MIANFEFVVECRYRISGINSAEQKFLFSLKSFHLSIIIFHYCYSKGAYKIVFFLKRKTTEHSSNK